jgi:hypothetical protein
LLSVSITKWYLMSICFALWWNSGFLTKRMALWLSQDKGMVEVLLVQSPSKDDWSKLLPSRPHTQQYTQLRLLKGLYIFGACSPKKLVPNSIRRCILWLIFSYLCPLWNPHHSIQ